MHVVEEKAKIFAAEEEERRVNPFHAPPKAGPRLHALPVKRHENPLIPPTSYDRIPLVADDDPLIDLRVSGLKACQCWWMPSG